jgi:probable HAF family extracellular repeat protein
MNGIMQSRWAWSSAIAVFGLSVPALAAPPELSLMYELQDLGTLGGPNVQVLDMNDDGTWVVGWAETAARTRHAFMWTEKTGMVDLLGLGGGWSEAHGVNNVGQVVGTAMAPGGEMHAFLAFNRQVIDLNVLVPIDALGEVGEPRGQFVRFIEAMAINNDGAIVGCGFVEGRDEIRGFMLQPLDLGLPLSKYACFDLGELPLAEGCIPYDVSDFGEVVGVSGSRAFIWHKQIEPLDDISRPVIWESNANALNEHGVAVGWYRDAGLQTASLWWHGIRSDLVFQPGWSTEALGINNLEQIVGWAEPLALSGAQRTAVLWEGRKVYDLNDVVGIPAYVGFPWSHLNEAVEIDEGGRIVGTGSATDGRTRAFMLVPLPRE